MRKGTICTLTAWLLVLATAGVGHAEVAVDERNLEYGSEVTGVTLSDAERTMAGPDDAQPEALFTFPSDVSTVVGSQGFIDGEQAGFFWSETLGHSVLQAFAGDPTATSYQLNVDVITNTLSSETVKWDVLINSVKVDEFNVEPGFVGTISTGAIFPEISGPVYTVELIVRGVVSPGGGSHSLRYAGDGANTIRISGPGPEGIVLCLDDFCDTLDCGLDNGNIVTCSWNYNCAGTDNEPLAGAKLGSEIAMGGEITSAGDTYTWILDVPNSSFTLYGWDGVGQSFLQASGGFTLNSCDFARSGGSLLDSLR